MRQLIAARRLLDPFSTEPKRPPGQGQECGILTTPASVHAPGEMCRSPRATYPASSTGKRATGIRTRMTRRWKCRDRRS